MVSGMKTDMIIADLFYAITLLFSPFLFFNQCGLSITDVNIHSTRVCLRVDCVHVKLKQRVWLLRSTMWSFCWTFHFFSSVLSCFHWSQVLILYKHLVGRCVCVFVGSGLIFCSPKGIPMTEKKLNINKTSVLSIFFFSQGPIRNLSYLLFWELYMANGWIYIKKGLKFIVNDETNKLSILQN